jgi:hypothetical protein
MLKRILFVLTLCGPVAFAADPASPASGNPPSDATVKQLLEVMHGKTMVDSMMSQMDLMMKNALQQVTQGRPVPPEAQKTFDQCRTDVVAAMKEEFTWEKLEPMYVRIYQKSFTQVEVDGMIGFYKTPAGQAVISKMPLVMRNSMNEAMQMMGPMMKRIESMQQDVMTQIQAKGDKKDG